MDEACNEAGYEAGCLTLNKKFEPKDGPHPASKCKVADQSPDIDDKVSTSTRVTLYIKCPKPEDEPEPEDSNRSGEWGGSDSNNDTTTTGQQDE